MMSNFRIVSWNIYDLHNNKLLDNNFNDFISDLDLVSSHETLLSNHCGSRSVSSLDSFEIVHMLGILVILKT